MLQLLTDTDKQILLWIQFNLRNEHLTPLFAFITRLGDAGVFWIATCVVMLCVKKTRSAAGAALCSLIITFAVNELILKNIMARARPYDVIQGLSILIEKPGGYSFPSGHTACSFAAAVAIYCILPEKFGIPALIIACLIGFSRLYLGVHYLSDVLCGALLGTVIAIFVCKSVRGKFIT